MIKIRTEKENDLPAIREVNLSAFPTSEEADLVERLRRDADPLVSLVAELDGGVVGHILFSPVELPLQPTPPAMGLAPVAVLPERQNQGTGSALVRSGLHACRELGAPAVFVLGHPDFYPRFGFIPASSFDLKCEFDVPDEAFMALELKPGTLLGTSGVVKFHPDFQGV
jgi:putative acetyltransferase